MILKVAAWCASGLWRPAGVAVRWHIPIRLLYKAGVALAQPICHTQDMMQSNADLLGVVMFMILRRRAAGAVA